MAQPNKNARAVSAAKEAERQRRELENGSVGRALNRKGLGEKEDPPKPLVRVQTFTPDGRKIITFVRTGRDGNP